MIFSFYSHFFTWYYVHEWFHWNIKIMRNYPRVDFHFFCRRVGKILGGVQNICNMPFLMLWKGHEMASQSVPGRVKQNSSGVKHFLEGVKKNLGGCNPPNPPENPPIEISFVYIVCVLTFWSKCIVKTRFSDYYLLSQSYVRIDFQCLFKSLKRLFENHKDCCTWATVSIRALKISIL